MTGPGVNTSAQAQQSKKAALLLFGAFETAMCAAIVAAMSEQTALLWAVTWFLIWGTLVTAVHSIFFMLQASDLSYEEQKRHPLPDEPLRVMCDPLLPGFARMGQVVILGVGGAGLLALLYVWGDTSTPLSLDAITGVWCSAILFLLIGIALLFLQRYAGSIQAKIGSPQLNGTIHLARLGSWICIASAATLFDFLYADKDYSVWVGRGISLVTAVLVIDAGIRTGMAAIRARTFLDKMPPLGGSLVLEALFRRDNRRDIPGRSGDVASVGTQKDRSPVKRLSYLLVPLGLGAALLIASLVTRPTLGHAKSVKLSFDTLKQWTYIEGKTPIPDFIKKLDGQYVQMEGYMLTPNAAENISSFVLVPSQWGCCYGQPPAVNHVVSVKLTGNATTKYFTEAISVRGRFNVTEERIDGIFMSLYRLDADEVSPK